MAKEYNKTCLNTIHCEKCKYYNDNCELGNSTIMLLKWNKKIPKEQSITLKNIDTSIFTFCEQRNKFIENREKFDGSVIDCILSYACKEENTEKYKKYAIEEFWNMVQYGLGLLQKIDVDADEVMTEYPKHLEKIKKID